MNRDGRHGLNRGAKPWSPDSMEPRYQEGGNYDANAALPQQGQYPPLHSYPARGRGRGGGYNQSYPMNPPEGGYYGGPPMQDPGYTPPPVGMQMGRQQGHSGHQQPPPMNPNGAMRSGNYNRGGPMPSHMQQQRGPAQMYNSNMNAQQQQQYNNNNNMPPHQQPMPVLPGQYPVQHQSNMGSGGYHMGQPPMSGGPHMNSPPPGAPSYQHQRQVPPQTHMPPPPSHQLSSQQQRSPMPAGAPTPPQEQPAAAPTYARGDPVPKVIMVTGYSRTGKTTVAKEIAKDRQYEYISLAPGKVKDSNRKEEAGDEEEEEEDEEYHSLEARFAPLSKLLSRKSSIKGIVIDDALIYNKFEPYYVVFMLEKAGLQLDYLVIITTELNSLIERGVKFDSNKKMKAHPESFEFGALLESHNAATNGSTPIAVVDGECELELVVKDSLKQLKEVEGRGLAPLRLPEVNFIPNCPLVSDPHLVDKVLAAERAGLGLPKLEYGFPYAEPNFLMEYVQFARHSLLFKQYQIVPWIWGDKVSVIGYDDDVYVHLPSYKVLFHLNDISAPLKEMIEQLKSEVATKHHDPNEGPADEEAPRTPSPAAAEGEKKCLFSLEATMLNAVLYISDMMVLGPHLGSRMLLPDRVALMRERLGKLPATGPLRLLEHYHVREISKCLKAYAEVARGVLFVNPDGMEAGSYDSRNFIYPSEEVKSVKIRIWGGRVEGDGVWVFDALASDSGKDTPIINADGTGTLVYISNEDVDQYSVNDGDIVECIEEQSNNTAVQQKGGKKGAKSTASSTHLAFQRRCEWQVDPTTLYYQSAFLSKPAWPTNLFLEACSSIRYEAPVASGAA